MTTALSAEFDRVAWYGRGPHETYWDRKTGGEIGLYQRSVEELLHPYIRAQDVGNRADVRWVAFTNSEGFGLKVTGHEPLNFSAWPFTAADLERATHDYQLPRRDRVTVNIDHQLHGVGGDNSWGARTHPEYTLPGGKPYRYTFTLSPVRPGK
jgi:beta-galactosidase